MILSDRDIKQRLERGDLVVEPLASVERQVQPASIDLRLAREFLVYRSAQVPCLDPRAPETLTAAVERILATDADGFILHPGEFALGSTIEKVHIPADLAARVEGRSSIGRLAIVVHATAGFIDPGFRGTITLELSNIGRIPVRLHVGMRIAQIVLHQMSSPAESPYSEARGSSYHGQEGPQVSRLKLD